MNDRRSDATEGRRDATEGRRDADAGRRDADAGRPTANGGRPDAADRVSDATAGRSAAADGGPAATQLPAGVVDHGDRIEVAADTSTRILSLVFGGVLVAVGLVIMIFAPGDLGEGVIARFGVGGLLVVIGATALMARNRRLEFDATGVTLHQAFGDRRAAWDDIVEARLERRYQRVGVGGLGRRLPGGLTISAGPGGGRGRRGPAVTKDEPYLQLRLMGDMDGRDLTMDLNQANVDDGNALIAALGERGWLPSTIEVTVDAPH